MNTERSNIGSGLWFQWVLANALGLSVGSFVGEALNLTSFGGVTFGIVLGCLQWFVLRHHLSQAGRWVLASIAGWAVGGVTAFATQRSGASIEAIRTVAGFTGITAAGILQWLVLRRQVHQAGWWIFASIGSLLVAGMVIRGFNPLAGAYAVEGGGLADLVARAVVRILPGTVMGAVNGAVLVWLLSQPLADKERSLAST